MSQLGTLEAGSRHDLRVGLSPDAPDESRIPRRPEGRVRLRAFLRDLLALRRAGRAGRAVRIGLPAALLLLPQPRHLAPQGRHLCVGPAGDRPAGLLRAGAARARRRPHDLGRRADGADRTSPGESWPAPSKLGLHTAIETSGFLGDRADDEYLSCLDLVLLDIKSSDPETYRTVTGRDLAPTLRFAERLAAARQARMGALHAGAGPYRRSRECRGHRAVRGADEERRMGRGAAVPPDGRVQMEGDEAALQARRHAGLPRLISSSGCSISSAPPAATYADHHER